MSPIRYQSEECDISRLDRPLKFEFSRKTAKNRFLKAAMTERLSSWDPGNFKARGVPSQNLINVYKRWGEGGFGQILTGNIMIDFDQLEAMGNMIIPRESIFSGARFEAFKELAAAGKAHGSLVVGQVCHPGRQVGDIIQADPISASDIQLESSSQSYCYTLPC
jgi:2,4-dienoyl-CoA reductase-like NADH-dependent reductase (Old Yellow Enzyme family)